MNSPFTFYRGAALNWAADLAATHASGLRVKWIVLGVALIVPALALCARAQIDQVLPEIDVYHKLSSDLRFSFQAKETREGGAPTQIFGASESCVAEVFHCMAFIAVFLSSSSLFLTFHFS